jgi:hypothetical protein
MGLERETCLRCGHRWIRRQDAKPVQCPRCRSAYWDRVREGPEPIDARPGLSASSSANQPDPSLPHTEKRDSGPDQAVDQGAENPSPDPHPPGQTGRLVSADAELCPFRELDRERGEWVYCALPPHPAKVKHLPGRRESA